MGTTSETTQKILSTANKPDNQKSIPGRIWDGWKKVGLFIGKVNLYVLTFIVYWTIFALTSIIAKILRRDFLNIRKAKGIASYWAKLPEMEASMDSSKRQF